MKLSDLENKKILLFGKSRSFSSSEFDAQMNYHKITIVKEYSDAVVLLVDGRMMTPYEQNLSDKLYEEQNVSFISIDIIEKELVKAMDANTLLMSLKLSNDKDRLKDFMTNSMIDDELFFKLLKMYSWGMDDFFETDDNRDVSAAFIFRFYENIERNHNVQYATTGFIHLVSQTKDAKLLSEIASLKPLAFHPKIKSAIAMSIYCDEVMQKRFFASGDEKMLKALSINKNLHHSLVQEFLDDETLGSNMAYSIELNDELFKMLQNYKNALSCNESLSLDMQEKLLSYGDKDIDFALASNNGVDGKIIEKLLISSDEKIKIALHENSQTPVAILEEAYENSEYFIALAKNENTPIDILYQLQLDSRYERFVKTNASYGKHIQSQNIGWLV